MRHLERLAHHPHRVHPEQPGAPEVRGHAGGGGGPIAVAHVAAGEMAQEPLARGAHHDREAEFRQDIDPTFAATVVYGSIDELLTGWVLGRLPSAEEDVAKAEQTLIELILVGLQDS